MQLLEYSERLNKAKKKKKAVKKELQELGKKYDQMDAFHRNFIWCPLCSGQTMDACELCMGERRLPRYAVANIFYFTMSGATHDGVTCSSC